MVDLDIFLRVLILATLSAIGYFAGRILRIGATDISKLLIYIVAPVVVVLAVLEAPSDRSYLALTAGSFIFCSIIALSALWVSRFFWNDNTRNLFAFSGGTGNTGYFGLPIAMSIFGDVGAAVAVFLIIGVMLYEFSLGYYLTSVGGSSAWASLHRVLKVPTFYAFIFALFLDRTVSFQSETILAGFAGFKGAYSVLGMIVVGIALSTFEKLEIDVKYIAISFVWKFCIWPVACFGVVTLFDQYLSDVERAVVMLMSVVPMAGNTVVVASALSVHPQKAATAVVLSTGFSVLSVPLSIAFIA